MSTDERRPFSSGQVMYQAFALPRDRNVDAATLDARWCDQCQVGFVVMEPRRGWWPTRTLFVLHDRLCPISLASVARYPGQDFTGDVHRDLRAQMEGIEDDDIEMEIAWCREVTDLGDLLDDLDDETDGGGDDDAR